MARVRKIQRSPEKKNYFLIDTNFLVNKYIKPSFYDRLPDPRGKWRREKGRVERCLEWWSEIDGQLARGKARIYIPDVCIAEAFKVLAKKRYQEKVFRSAEYNVAKNKLSREITTSVRVLKAQRRIVKYHDVSTCRDIIISVDRFFEMFAKKGKNVQIADLIVIATAKYLMDFYDIPKDALHLITLDSELWAGIKHITDLPCPFNPTLQANNVARIFE